MTTIEQNNIKTNADELKPHGLHDVFLRFILWREKHVKEKTFLLFVAFLVGIFGGLAALLLKALIHFISTALTAHVNISAGNYVYIILPAIGVIISALYVRYVVKDDIDYAFRGTIPLWHFGFLY